MKEDISGFAELVKKSQYTQKEIAEKIFISTVSLHYYMTGKRTPDLRILFDLCCVCECNFEKVVKNFTITDLKAAFERFYYKLADKNKYIQGMKKFILTSENLCYLTNEIEAIYRDNEPQVEQNNSDISDLENRVKTLESEVELLKNQIDLLCRILNPKETK